MENKSDNSSESFFKKITYTEGIYPVFSIEKNEHPNRFFAVPLLGMLVKILLLIPVFILVIFVMTWLLIAVMIINPFVVLFTGKYWVHAYEFVLGFMRLSAKVSAYVYGLTDKYPGFDFQTPPGLKLDIPMPQTSNRLYAIPVLGLLIRMVLLIPYFIFENVITQAVSIGAFFLAWAAVLFTGKYPDGIFELARDSIRVNISASVYIFGLSDRYPSFYISMAHDKIKIILIAIAIILGGWRYSQDINKSYTSKTQPTDYQMQPQVQQPVNIINNSITN